MPVKHLFFICAFVSAFPFWAQVQLRGLSFWNEPTLDIYQIENQLSQQKKWLQQVSPDSMGIFNAQLDLQQITTLQICSSNKCARLYTQPKGRYLIELPEVEQQTFYNLQQEIELLFYQLDTNDINYRILGFEAWMDNYIADIYQLKDIRSNEFIVKVLAFKAETAMVYGEETNSFLRDYIKYSIGLTIDNFSVIGGPSKDDKFNFYLQTDSVNYQQPKLIEYAQFFYENYDSQVDQKVRNAIEIALQTSSLEALLKALLQDPYIYNTSWAEFVALTLILECEQTNRLQKDLALELLLSLSKNGQQQDLREAASYFWAVKSKLSNGQTWNKTYVEKQLGLRLEPKQYIYLHHYIPGNQNCSRLSLAQGRSLENSPFASPGEGLYYTVQVGVYNRPLTNEAQLGLPELIEAKTAKGQFRYASGKFANLQDAKKRQQLAVNKGIKDAFVVAYYQGKRIDLVQAKLLAQSGIAFEQNFEQNKVQPLSLALQNQLLALQIPQPQPLIVPDPVCRFEIKCTDCQAELSRYNRVGVFIFDPEKEIIVSALQKTSEWDVVQLMYLKEMRKKTPVMKGETQTIQLAPNGLEGALIDWLLRQQNGYELDKDQEGELQLRYILPTSN